MSINFDYLGHMAKFNRQIVDVQEFATRLQQFTVVHNYINEHNTTGASWTAGHNQFSDWSYPEYKAMLGYTGRRGERKASTWFTETNADSVNWVTAGAVTPVKDQGQCGSCWSFSTTGSLEGAHFNATGELLSFSEQQLVDCSGFPNMGCNGGNPLWAFKYLKKHDAELESVYGYVSGTTKTAGTCAYDSSSATSVEV